MAVGTLAAMRARIASELARSDLTSQINDAINDAIAICQKYRFRFCETSAGNPPDFITAIDTTEYAIPLPGFFAIDYMELQLGAPGLQHMRRVQPEMARQMAQLIGVPNTFAVEGDRILIGPNPTALYLIYAHGHIVVPAPVEGEVLNRWMTDGERMIRVLAKREIARDVTRNPTMWADMNKAFIAEATQLISEAGRLDLFQGMLMRQENIKAPEDVIQ